MTEQKNAPAADPKAAGDKENVKGGRLAELERQFAERERYIADLEARIAKLEARTGIDPAYAKKFAELDAALAKMARAMPVDIPLTAEEYRTELAKGTDSYLVLADCRSAKLTVLRGARIRRADHDQNLIVDLIAKGALKVRVAA